MTVVDKLGRPLVVGDLVTLRTGRHSGLRGFVQSIEPLPGNQVDTWRLSVKVGRARSLEPDRSMNWQSTSVVRVTPKGERA